MRSVLLGVGWLVAACASGAVDTGQSPGPTATPNDFPDPVADECITDVTAGSHVFSCSELRFNVRVPELCLSQACGVILDVHGFTMSGQMEENNTGLAENGAAAGFVVVQPNATPDPPSASWTPDVDDPKVFDFLQRTVAAWHLDEKRVHFTGFSQGGYMTWRMVCAHPETFASVAPGAAADGCGGNVQPACNDFPAEEVSILYMHGTADTLVAYSCAEPQRDLVIDAWDLASEQMVASGADYTWSRYSNARGIDLEFIRHDYTGHEVLGGHCFPGSDDVDGNEPGQLMGFGCYEDTAFHWGEAVLQFFLDHPKP